MTTIVTRAGKGSPLTNNEVDTNFTNLNDAKIETLTSTNGSIVITGTGSTRNLSITGSTAGGGGASVSYYLNGSVNQGTIGGNTYYEMSRSPIFGAGTDFTIAADGYIAQFITDANDPSLLAIPAGNWNFEMYFSASAAGGSPAFYLELYKYNGTTFTLITSGSTNPEGITGGTSTDLYITSLAVPQTALAITDRLAIRVYVIHSGRTITLHTEDNNLCQVITTFSTGLTALNGLTAQVQGFAVGTAGTDFNISSVTDVHTFNLPSASASVRGALTSADWTTFNNKVTSVAGTATRITSSGGTTPVIDLASGVVTAGTTGSSTLIPVITVDTYGRVTSVTTAANPQGTVTSVTGTSPVVSSGGATPAISLASGYGDTQNPYASKTANNFLAAPNGTAGVPTFRAIVAADIPTLNQNTTGTASNVTGTVAIANGGTGATTQQTAINALAGAVTSGQYLRGNGTNVVMSAIQAGDVPTLNQNTTGTASNVTGVVAVANGGTGLSSTPTNGQLDIGNGTGFTRATLTAGTGISVTNGAGTISIANSGVTSVAAGSGISVSASTGGVTITNTSTGATITDDTTTNATRYIVFDDITSGTLSSAFVSSTKLTYNPSTGTASATVFSATSDERLKDEITIITDALAKIKQLRGINYKWKDSGLAGTGLSAQDVQRVVPEAVVVAPNGDLSVAYGNLLGLLVEGMKDLAAQVEELKLKVGK